MPETYTKEDLDRAYQAGVANSEKLWRSLLLNMLDSGSVEMSYLKCNKCHSRFRIEPDKTYPTRVVCPVCVREGYSEIGTCSVERRRTEITAYEVRNISNAVEGLLNPLVTFQKTMEESPAAQGMTMAQATQLPTYRALIAQAGHLRQIMESGWKTGVETHKLTDSDLKFRPEGLERYNPEETGARDQ